MTSHISTAIQPGVDGTDITITQILTATAPEKIIGLRLGSPTAQIRARYLRLALKFHPDKAHPVDRGIYTTCFQKIKQAYDYFIGTQESRRLDHNADEDDVEETWESNSVLLRMRRQDTMEREKLKAAWTKWKAEQERNDRAMNEVRRKVGARLNAKYRRPKVPKRTMNASSSLSVIDDNSLPWE